MLERAPSFRDYARAPRGRALAGPSWLAFCASPTLWGFALWGRVGVDDMRALLDALVLELDEQSAPHSSLVDASRLTAADTGSFDALTRYVDDNRAALERKVTRLAIVHPTSGFEGALVAGFYGVVAPPYPVTLAPDVCTALAQLGVDGALESALARVVEDAAGAVPLLGALRAALARSPKLSLDDAARVLHVSARTLQRRLGESGTSYSDVQASVRLERALERIRSSSEPLTSIAIDVGFSSPQHMSRAVKLATGLTPTALRSST